MNSMNQLQAQQEVRVSREDEARRLKLEEETSADMALLRAILDAEDVYKRQALRGVEEAVDDGVEALAACKGVYEQRADHGVAYEAAPAGEVVARDGLIACLLYTSLHRSDGLSSHF